MALLKKTQRSFSGGMIDKDLTGRQDLSKYSQGCLELVNFRVRKQGNVTKRSGTDMICDLSAIITSGNSRPRLFPVIQDRNSGYYLLMSGGKAYLLSNDGMKMADGSWSSSPTPGTGTKWVPASLPSGISFDGIQPYFSLEIPGYWIWADWQGHRWMAASGDQGATQLSFESTYEGQPHSFTANKVTNPQPHSVDIPFSDDDLRDVDYCQSGDTIFFAHRSYPPCKIVYSGGEISYERINFRQTHGTPPEILALSCEGTWNGEEYGGAQVDVEYAVSSVKDGVESELSESKSLEYYLPWPENGTIEVNVNVSGLGADSFDKINVYKRDGDIFGFIGSLKISDRETMNVSSGFAISNTANYPGLFTNFSQDDFLRDVTRNNFASVSETLFGNTISRSQTSHKKRNSGSTYMQFTWSSKRKITSFAVGIGSLLHRINKEESGGVSTWKASYSDFYSTGATYFKADIRYDNEGTATWTTSKFPCRGAINQTPTGAGWIETASGSGTWRKTYSGSSEISSTASASDVQTKMSNPDVDPIVWFDIPAEHLGKKITGIRLYGYSSSESTTSMIFVANGVSFFGRNGTGGIFSDDYITPDVSITPEKSEDHFMSAGDYPGCVQMYEQRLVYSSSVNNPFTFWMSCTGDLYNFNSHDYIRASDAITATIAATEMPRINRMVMHRDLMLFTDGGEWLVSPSSGNAIAPSTVSAKMQSAIGCASWLTPIRIGDEIIFCDRSGESLISTKYSFVSDSYESTNLSVLSQRIFRNNPIQAMAYAQFPESTIECVLTDGTVASLVYMKEHEVCSWSKHTLGGNWKALDVAANKSSPSGSSSCVFLAKRTTYGTEFAALKVRDVDPDDNSTLNNIRLDAVMKFVKYEEDPYLPPFVRDYCIYEIARLYGARVYVCGPTFTSIMRTVSPEFTERETAQMEIKSATEAEIRVIEGSSFEVYQSDIIQMEGTWRNGTFIEVGCAEDATNHTLTPSDADVRVPLAGINSRNGSITIRHERSTPLTILSVSVSYRFEYANHSGEGGSNGEG